MWAIVIADENGRVITWRAFEAGGCGDGRLRRVGDRFLLKVFTAYGRNYRFELIGDEIRPIRLEPRPSRKSLEKIVRLGGEVFCGVIRYIDFSKSKIKDDDFAEIPDALDIVGVDWLNLEGMRLNGAGLRYLKDQGNLSQLTLDNTAVDDAGVVHLARFKGLEVSVVDRLPSSGKNSRRAEGSGRAEDLVA